MSFDEEMNILIQRYLKEVEDIQISLDKLKDFKRWERVYYFRLARHKYQDSPITEMTMDELKRIYGD